VDAIIEEPSDFCDSYDCKSDTQTKAGDASRNRAGKAIAQSALETRRARTGHR